MTTLQRRCLSKAKNRWYMAWILEKGYFRKPKEADLPRGLGFHVFFEVFLKKGRIF